MVIKNNKLICQNKKALFDYHVEETIEAGISLIGTEVKSLRLGGGNLLDSHIARDNDGMIVFNFRIAPYRFSPHDKMHDPLRNKRLLLHKRQIERLASKAQQKGFTIVPLRVYFNKKNRIKVEIALVKGKKLYDKRETIKRRDLAREARRNLLDS